MLSGTTPDIRLDVVDNCFENADSTCILHVFSPVLHRHFDEPCTMYHSLYFLYSIIIEITITDFHLYLLTADFKAKLPRIGQLFRTERKKGVANAGYRSHQTRVFLQGQYGEDEIELVLL